MATPETANQVAVRIPRRKELTARVGLFGVGYYKYWDQFPGLKERLYEKIETLARKLRINNVDVSNYGLVDDAKSAYRLRDIILKDQPDLVFCDMVTYATSATFGVLVRDINIPIVLVALQPMKALDYERATTEMQLYNDDFCAVPEFTGVAIRMSKKTPPVILGTLEDDPHVDAELKDWCQIAYVLHDLRRARIGYFGHPIEHMFDMQTDQTALMATFGCHIVQTEADQLLKHYRAVTQSDLQAKIKQILEVFDTPDPKSDPLTEKLTSDDLEVAARVAVALDRFVEEHELDGLAYYYEAEPRSELHEIVTNLIVGNSLLTAAGFPMCGEADLKTCIAMLIEDRLEMGGSFAEFHPIDFNEGFVLVGHDGPHHINIAEGKPILRSLKKYHGKPGKGASVEFKIKEGPITILSIGVGRSGKFKFVIAEGESVKGPIPATGNTNTRGFFGENIRSFLKRWVAEGPTHHFALGVGHRADTLANLGELLDVEVAVVRKGQE